MPERRHSLSTDADQPGFSLLEVLVVVGMMAILASVLLPGLSAARQHAAAVMCSSNIQQIIRANGYYAEDHNGVYCPGASDFRANRDRWHGRRERAGQPFESTSGPLASFLGPDREVRECPRFPARELAQEGGGFERGNGGYGYNNAYLGVRLRRAPTGEHTVETDRAGALVGRVARPADTIMFADSAFAGQALIEYSFAEPRFHPQYPTYRADPSIHFRHRSRANVGWCDGHVDAQRRTFSWSSGLYPKPPDRYEIGWPGKTDDNSLFDLE